MTRYARVELGSVREVVDVSGPISELYHPDLVWVEVGDRPDVAEGWVVRPEGFSPPEAASVPVASPQVGVEELAKQVSELRDQLRTLIAQGTGQHREVV